MVGLRLLCLLCGAAALRPPLSLPSTLSRPQEVPRRDALGIAVSSLLLTSSASGVGRAVAADDAVAAPADAAAAAVTSSYRDEVFGCELRYPARLSVSAPLKQLSMMSGGRTVTFAAKGGGGGGGGASPSWPASVTLSGSLIPPNGKFRSVRDAFTAEDAAESLLGEFYRAPGVDVLRSEFVSLGGDGGGTPTDAFVLEARGVGPTREPKQHVVALLTVHSEGEQNMNMAPTWLVALLTACPEARWDAEPRLAAELRDLVGSFRLFAFE